MQKLQFVKNLVVEKANYILEDEQGNKLELIVDYAANSFKISESMTEPESEFWKESERFASGLLARKHGANLAEREQYL